MTRNFEFPGRSAVRSMNAMASTSHPLATSTALQVLMQGGNAIDAAVAASAVQSVVEPQSTGIGGDGFALISMGGSDDIRGINASGRSPMAASVEKMKALGLEAIPRQSPHSVTIPGAVDGWDQMLKAHGTWDLGRCLEPAIGYALNGYPVHDCVNRDWKTQTDLLMADDFARSNLLVAEEAPQVGSVMKHTELGRTLEAVAEKGAEAFYQGPIAEAMVSFLADKGGLHTMEDFAACSADWVQPISTTYNEHRIWQIPPNGQGMVVLLMLNILEGFENEGLEPTSALRLHREIEAARWGYAARDAYLGQTPSQSLEWLISKDYAAECRARIDDFTASEPLPQIDPGVTHKDTVYLTVVDKDRNAVSLINSIFNPFGSGQVCPKTGVVFQNRGASFNLTPGHANCLEGGKRPMHTIIPGMITNKAGRVSHAYGVMGGQYQPFGHAHVLTNHFDFGMNPQEAIDAPRVMADASNAVEVEQSLPLAAREKLAGMGHKIVDTPMPIGGAQMIQIDWDLGTLTAGSDPRKDGHSAGY